MHPSVAHTGLVTHPRCLDHYPGPGHPERPERLAAVLSRLESSGLAAELARLRAPPAPPARLIAVHPREHLSAMERACQQGRAMLDSGDTYVCDASFEAAVLAAGGLLAAVERVLDGRWHNAFVAVRPPGHHAEEATAMGFCLINHVAVAARFLREAGHLERVAILDWDVHHGNGTQHLFEHDPSVFYASLHQYPHYPGTGAADERGRGAGEGATLNCPMEAGSGDAEWVDVLERRVLPALEDFRPQFVLVSAGFDAHADDPLSGTRVSEDGYRRMTRAVADLARRSAGGRLVSLLEGGYHLDALARSVEVHVAELLEA
jgi:acetoin utilization deacetylase AcuC-like enzyme